MRVRVFEAENMQSALRQVKEELGPKAIIISTRTVRKGKTGVFNKPKLEVTAALEAEEGAEEASSGQKGGSRQPAPVLGTSGPETDVHRRKASRAQAAYSRSRSGPVSQPEAASNSVPSGGKSRVSNPGEGKKPKPEDNGSYDPALQTIQGEIAELRQMVKDLRSTGAQTGTYPAAPGTVAEAEDPVLDTLLRRGLEWDVACKAAARFNQEYHPDEVADESRFMEGINSVLAGLITSRDPLWEQQGGDKRRVALLGPTGAGKTTTIAKLAANYLSRVSSRIALVTIDNYRIAAVEQLKIYADIMNIPLEVVTSASHIPTTFARHEDKDLILVDTAGRSPHDEESLQELNSFLSSGTGVENHLLLSATTREQAMQRTINSFQAVGLNGLVFTKMDECEDFGSLFNIHIRNEYPLSYFTTGQKVPEDLMAADGHYLAERLIEQTRETSDV